MPDDREHHPDRDIAMLAQIIGPRSRQQHQRRRHFHGGDGDDHVEGTAHPGSNAGIAAGRWEDLRRVLQRLSTGARKGPETARRLSSARRPVGVASRPHRAQSTSRLDVTASTAPETTESKVSLRIGHDANQPRQGTL